MLRSTSVVTNQMKDTNDFHKKLITIIDKVLKESFGESSLLIYSWLKIHSVYPEEIPEKLDAFVDALKIFSVGGSVLEAMILKDLYSSYGLEFKQTNENYSFTDYITELRNCLKH